MRFPLQAKLKDGTPIELILAGERDIAAVHHLFCVILEEGTSYPHHQPLSEKEIADYWFQGKSTIAVYLHPHAPGGPLVGAFYLKPNWPGRARQVANAGFMVHPAWRNKGLGWLLGAIMLQYAKSLGYRSVMFNLVFSENVSARSLWMKLGFREIGVIPQAIANDKGAFQDGIIMFRSLDDTPDIPAVRTES